MNTKKVGAGLRLGRRSLKLCVRALVKRDFNVAKARALQVKVCLRVICKGLLGIKDADASK